MRHFIAARRMVDVTNCRTLVSLQALISMILFLMSTARLATAHTYVGVAVASAVRLGLHSKKSANENFDDLERDLRKRIFWTIVKLDIYSGSVLGLPALINLQEIDQTRPIEASNHTLSYSPGAPSKPTREATRLAASGKHLEMLLIIAEAIRMLYPVKLTKPNDEGGRRTFFVSNTKIVKVEQQIKEWRESLSDLLRDEDDSHMLTGYVRI